MDSTCLFCSGPLGSNEVIEEFPVGRRLAFDPEKGRLWALCPRCRRWNLSPLEERWEALESLERVFRDTPTRYSTAQIGLARHREGLEVVRIGRPLRPEYAAWRYGTELRRRRRRAVLAGGVGAVALVVGLGGASMLMPVGAAASMLSSGVSLTLSRRHRRLWGRISGPDGTPLLLQHHHAIRTSIVMGNDGVCRLRVPHPPVGGPLGGTEEGARPGQRGEPFVVLEENDAVAAVARIMPLLNRTGAGRRTVRTASRFVEEAGSPEQALRRAWETLPEKWRDFPAGSVLHALRSPVRLGLEMAAQEAWERRALESELALLKREWRRAEEIAAIADDLLLPAGIRARLHR